MEQGLYQDQKCQSTKRLVMPVCGRCDDVDVLATASNPHANYVLLAVGGVTAGVAFLAGQAVAGLIGQ